MDKGRVVKELVRIEVDLNDIDANGITRAVHPALPEGVAVLAVEPEDGVIADAVVEGTDSTGKYLLLRIDWDSVRDDPAIGRDLQEVLASAFAQAVAKFSVTVGRELSTGPSLNIGWPGVRPSSSQPANNAAYQSFLPAQPANV